MSILKSKKVPLDIKFLGGICFVFSCYLFVLGLLLLSGIGKISPDEEPRRVFLGIFLLDTFFSYGIQEILYGTFGIIASIGVIKLQNWARLLLLSFLMICIIDALFVCSRFSMLTNVFYIAPFLLFSIWLFYRKPLFLERE